MLVRIFVKGREGHTDIELDAAEITALLNSECVSFPFFKDEDETNDIHVGFSKFKYDSQGARLLVILKKKSEPLNEPKSAFFT